MSFDLTYITIKKDKENSTLFAPLFHAYTNPQRSPSQPHCDSLPPQRHFSLLHHLRPRIPLSPSLASPHGIGTKKQ